MSLCKCQSKQELHQVTQLLKWPRKDQFQCQRHCLCQNLCQCRCQCTQLLCCHIPRLLDPPRALISILTYSLSTPQLYILALFPNLWKMTHTVMLFGTVALEAKIEYNNFGKCDHSLNFLLILLLLVQEQLFVKTWNVNEWNDQIDVDCNRSHCSIHFYFFIIKTSRTSWISFAC